MDSITNTETRLTINRAVQPSKKHPLRQVSELLCSQKNTLILNPVMFPTKHHQV